MTLQAAISSDHNLWCLGCGRSYPATETITTRRCPDHKPVPAADYIAEQESRIREMWPVVQAAMHTVDHWRFGQKGSLVNHDRLKPAIDQYRSTYQT